MHSGNTGEIGHTIMPWLECSFSLGHVCAAGLVATCKGNGSDMQMPFDRMGGTQQPIQITSEAMQSLHVELVTSINMRLRAPTWTMFGALIGDDTFHL
jgi:hypothetical protein